MSVRGFGPVRGHGHCACRIVLTSGEEGVSAPVQADDSFSVLCTQLPDNSRVETDNWGNESDREQKQGQLSRDPAALKNNNTYKNVIFFSSLSLFFFF